MKTRVVIYAEEGNVLTNGTVYGRTIYLAEGETADNYREITESEYNKILEDVEATEDDNNNI